ncbi:hypothetical protein PPERSA_11513 [Pseudocohnilembus persalinus]|uniref:Uncharacterized protein n=1 Tax=Pseudocohnilembus persalinus TaxID=266149 RepID=A0A0V0QXE8_PSEPJ|nr:hypothetical protein PPERSA_11513 [Pseudocohnilembus persalinus]|eukprot:KRX06868.1 hypothetical protein PPERSA_11513 [Pseudocohnilembus persalinus]
MKINEFKKNNNNINNHQNYNKNSTIGNLQDVTNTVQLRSSVTGNSHDFSGHFKLSQNIVDLFQVVKQNLDEASVQYLKSQINFEIDQQEQKNNNIPTQILNYLQKIFVYIIKAKTDTEEILFKKNEEECSDYEQMLQKLEAEVRQHIRIEQQLKIYAETNQQKVEDLLKEKDEQDIQIEEMKKQLQEFQRQSQAIQEEKQIHNKQIDDLKKELKILKDQNKSQQGVIQQQKQQLTDMSQINHSNINVNVSSSIQNMNSIKNTQQNTSNIYLNTSGNNNFNSQKNKSPLTLKQKYFEDEEQQQRNSQLVNEDRIKPALIHNEDDTTCQQSIGRNKRSMTTLSNTFKGLATDKDKSLKHLKNDIQNMQKTIQQNYSQHQSSGNQYHQQQQQQQYNKHNSSTHGSLNQEQFQQQKQKSYMQKKIEENSFNQKYSQSISQMPKQMPGNTGHENLYSKDFIKNSVKGFEDKMRKSYEKYGKANPQDIEKIKASIQMMGQKSQNPSQNGTNTNSTLCNTSHISNINQYNNGSSFSNTLQMTQKTREDSTQRQMTQQSSGSNSYLKKPTSNNTSQAYIKHSQGIQQYKNNSNNNINNNTNNINSTQNDKYIKNSNNFSNKTANTSVSNQQYTQHNSTKEYMDSERIKNLTKKIADMQSGIVNKTDIQQQYQMQQQFQQQQNKMQNGYNYAKNQPLTQQQQLNQYQKNAGQTTRERISSHHPISSVNNTEYHNKSIQQQQLQYQQQQVYNQQKSSLSQQQQIKNKYSKGGQQPQQQQTRGSENRSMSADIQSKSMQRLRMKSQFEKINNTNNNNNGNMNNQNTQQSTSFLKQAYKTGFYNQKK